MIFSHCGAAKKKADSFVKEGSGDERISFMERRGLRSFKTSFKMVSYPIFIVTVSIR